MVTPAAVVRADVCSDNETRCRIASSEGSVPVKSSVISAILPISADDPASPANTAAWETLAHWERPVLTLYSKQFDGSAMGPARVLSHIPGCKGQDHAMLDEASFYIVEDQPQELARRLIAFAGKEPANRTG